MRIAIQPCGDSSAKDHFIDTIQNLVPKSRIYPFLTPEQKIQFDIYCGDAVAVWGVTEGKKGQNKTKWQKLKSGDIALLYTNKLIFNQSKITLTIHNANLAKELWSVNDEGDTWEYIYFLDELQRIDLPIEVFNETIGYKPNYIVQGFNVIDGEKAEFVAELLGADGIATDLIDDVVDPQYIQSQLSKLLKTDLPSSAKTRAESQIFRKYLFGNKRTCMCDLCGRDLPTRLLVAAHIKPRSNCTDIEKRDLNVIFKACKLGCDELFEKSYLIVNESSQIVSTDNLSKSTEALKEYAKNLIGKKCNVFNDANAKYFKWRQDHIKRYTN